MYLLPVENQVRGIEGGGEEVGGRRRWGRGWEEEVGPGVVGRGGAGGGRKRWGWGWEEEVGRRRGSKFKQEVGGICKHEEGEEKMKLEVKYNL